MDQVTVCCISMTMTALIDATKLLFVYNGGHFIGPNPIGISDLSPRRCSICVEVHGSALCISRI